MSADQFAADYGVMSALRCVLPKARASLADPIVFDDEALTEHSHMMDARVLYHYLYRAELRGLDLQAETTALCDAWGWKLSPELAERIARRDFADAAEAGLMTPEDIAAAKARDAARPTCSERLIAEGVPRAD